MLKSIALLLTAIALTSLCSASGGTNTTPDTGQPIQLLEPQGSARSTEFLESLGLTQPTAAVAQQSCCKICRKGKACGNTCISQNKICHVGPGCACDG